MPYAGSWHQEWAEYKEVLWGPSALVAPGTQVFASGLGLAFFLIQILLQVSFSPEMGVGKA